MKKNLMPKSNAKTAYGLLSEIRRIILAEPKRYDQTDTLRLRKNEISELTREEDWPSCGTVGCVAGWTVALKRRTPVFGQILATASNILGLNEDQSEDLFSGIAAGHSGIGTARHARKGAAHIAKFQRRNVGQLKAKRV